MRRPSEMKYARAIDGAYIAYQAFGAGDPLLFISDGFIPVDFMDDEPRLANAMRRLATFSRVIRFDRRGVGGSDPVMPAEPPTLEQWVEDAVAVMAAENVGDSWVLAPSDGGLVALTLAAIHPKRVRGLVLVNAFARATAAPDHPWGLDPSFLREGTKAATMPDAPDSEFDLLSFIGPSVAGDVSFRNWWDRVGRRGASPATAQAFRRVVEDSDVRSLLPAVVAPTLVIHHVDNRFSSLGQGEFLARSMPAARLTRLPGGDALWWVSDQEELLGHVEEFLTGERQEPAARRPYLTVLFTDIVDSTSMASDLGDSAWGDRLDGYLRRAQTEVAAANGEYVKNTGDGCLAWFEGPVRAIRCAVALRDAAQQLGLETRAGIHAGDVELRGHDILGVNVHVAARVQTCASAGQVLVTKSVIDLVSGSGIEFDDRGQHTLKGVAGEWNLFAVQT